MVDQRTVPERSDALYCYERVEYCHPYRCSVCRHTWREWQSSSVPEPRSCPHCEAPPQSEPDPDEWARWHARKWRALQRALAEAREARAEALSQRLVVQEQARKLLDLECKLAEAQGGYLVRQ